MRGVVQWVVFLPFFFGPLDSIVLICFFFAISYMSFGCSYVVLARTLEARTLVLRKTCRYQGFSSLWLALRKSTANAGVFTRGCHIRCLAEQSAGGILAGLNTA